MMAQLVDYTKKQMAQMEGSLKGYVDKQIAAQKVNADEGPGS